MWVVLAAFVTFAQCVGMAWCDGDVSGTRQGSCRCGGGDHYVEVDGGVSGVESDVRSVQGCVFVSVAGVGWVLDDDLLNEWALFGDTEDEGGEVVS